MLIDGCIGGKLTGGEPIGFDVEQGEHTITVFFRDRPAIFHSPRLAKSFITVSFAEGERGGLVSGIVPDVAMRWVLARRVRDLRSMIFAVAPFILEIREQATQA